MCSICEHESRIDIDRAIVSRESYNSIHKRFHISRNTIKAHAEQCMGRTDAMLYAVASSKEQLAEQVPNYQTGALLTHTAALQASQRDRLMRLSDLAEEVLLEVKAKGDARNFASNLTALRQTIESVCRPNPGDQTLHITTDVRQSPEWLALMRLMRAHPELNDELLGYLA